ncbi:MAG: DUF669 domain-containing protein [Treponema sp.]
MRFGEGYKIDDGYFIEVKPGEYNCKINKLQLKQTKSGKPMIEMKLLLQGGGLVTYYLVDDRSTADLAIMSNQRLTKFFDCFGINRGNFNINQWLGARGRVKLDYGKPNSDGNIYIEVKSLLLPIKKENKDSSIPHQNTMQRSTSQNMSTQERPKAYQNETLKEPTNAQLMEDARNRGLEVSDEYIYEKEEPNNQPLDFSNSDGYEEPDIY